jgi:hypothetical protein
MSGWGYQDCGVMWRNVAGLGSAVKGGDAALRRLHLLAVYWHFSLSSPYRLGLRLKRLFLAIGVAPAAFAEQVTSPPEAWSAPSSSPSRPISATPPSQSTHRALAHYLESSIVADIVSADGHSLPPIACAVGHSWLWALP